MGIVNKFRGKMKVFVCLLLAALTAIASSRTLVRQKTWAIDAFMHQSKAAPADGNLVEVAQSLGLKILVRAVTDAGLAKTIATGGPFTIFAPTDEAFMGLPRKVQEELKRNTTLLTQVLEYHVTNGKVLSTQLQNDLLVPTLIKTNVRVNLYQDGKIATINGAKVTKADQMATNGVIHVINRVMFPIPMGSVVDVVVKDQDFSTLLKAVQTAKLATTLSGNGPFTVFAPTNEAFAKLPPGVLDNLLKNVTALTDVLTYHVVSGTFYSQGLASGDVKTLEGKNVQVSVGDDGVMINTAKVIMADLSVTNGVIHVIDSVLIPPKMSFKLSY